MSHIFCGDCGYYSYQKNALLCTSVKCSCGGIAHVLKTERPVDENVIDESSADEISVSSDEIMDSDTSNSSENSIPPAQPNSVVVHDEHNTFSYVMIQLPFD
jgi:hypothetical protein